MSSIKKIKCTQCKKKLLFSYDCTKCKKSFCVNHRHYESHNCVCIESDDIDKDNLKNVLVKCVAEKVSKI